MNTKEQLITFEIISLLIIMLCLFLTMIKSDHLKIRGLKVVSHYAMWLFFIYFLFNTITNLLAQTLFEKSMAILTIALSIGSLRLSIEKLPKTNKSDA